MLTCLPKDEEFHQTAGWDYFGDILITGIRRYENPTIPVLLPMDWKSKILSSPHSTWICTWMSLPRDPSVCAAQLYAGKAMAVSDGSYSKEDDLCTAAWTISFDTAERARGGGVVPGPLGDNNAYRAELGGLLGQLLVLESIERLVPPQESYSIRVACDGKSALFRSMITSREEFNSRQKCFDLISAIISIRGRLRGTIHPIHVYGHQDDVNTSLTQLEVLNVEMDSLAKAIMAETIRQNQDMPDALPITADGLIQVDYKDIPITSNLASTIRYHVGKDRIMEWWKYKHRFQPGISPQDIDWEVMRRVSEEQSFAMRRFVSKWVSHHISVGRMMVFRSSRDTLECPCCGHQEETTIHVLRCPASSCRLKWNKELHHLDKWMRDNRTSPQLQDAIYGALRGFYLEEFNTYCPPGTVGPVRECIEAQVAIGWVGFVEGLFTPKWAHLQDKYFKSLGYRRTGRQWAVNLSKQL